MRKVAEDCLQTKLLHEMLVKVKRQLAWHSWESSSRWGENSEKLLLSWGILKDQEILTTCVRQWRSQTANVGCRIKKFACKSEWKRSSSALDAT